MANAWHAGCDESFGVLAAFGLPTLVLVRLWFVVSAPHSSVLTNTVDTVRHRCSRALRSSKVLETRGCNPRVPTSSTNDHTRSKTFLPFLIPEVQTINVRPNSRERTPPTLVVASISSIRSYCSYCSTIYYHAVQSICV